MTTKNVLPPDTLRAPEATGAIDVAQLRRDEFAWMDRGDVVYMNAASTGPMPRSAIEAQVEFTRRRAEPHRISFEDQFGVLDRCRALVARLIGADAGEIALAGNTGAGLNLAAWGLPLGAGDEVILSDGEYPANMYPWLAAAKSRGFGVHVVPMRDGLLDEDALLAAIERPGVRVLSVAWVGFVTGFVADLDRLGAACQAKGVTLVVDAIQGVGTLPLDLRRTPADILACGAQKWLLGPWGAGFTYVRREIMERITPQPVSWMAVRDSDDFSRLLDYDPTWRDNARRFEQVTLAYQDFAGMAASLELFESLGVANVAERISGNASRLAEGAARAGLRVVTPSDRRAGIVCIAPKDGVKASAALDAKGIVHSLREGRIRLSPHVYTSSEEIERTLTALK